jgi:hypothetical protein
MKILTIIGIVILILVVGVGVWFFIPSVHAPANQANNIDNQEQIVGGDADEHGCLGSAGYLWCEQKQKCLRVFEEFCPSETEDLVANIKENTGIEFVSSGATTFRWNNAENGQFTGKDIEGVQYKVENIKQADYQKIEDFMKNNYEQNIGNQADGVVGGERGYVVGYMACVLDFTHTEMINTPGAPSVPANDILNATLSCGFFNKNNQ